MPVEHAFRAMGSTCRVLAYGIDQAAVERVAARVEELEQRWSRFRPDSEISRLNATPDTLTIVSPETFLLVRRAVDAWTITGGRFDPTVLPALLDLGYDRSFELLDAEPITAEPTPHARDDRSTPRSAPSPGCAGVELFDAPSAIVLPRGVTIDPGGIGKGLAADLVAGELIAGGARGVAVDIGGDVRVAGLPPTPDGWQIDLEDSRRPGTTLATVHLAQGAVATSSTQRRRWRSTEQPVAHHLIDPTTGRPVDGPLVQVSVVASEAWWAEVLTKVVFASPSNPSTGSPDLFGCRVLRLDRDGVLHDSADELAA